MNVFYIDKDPEVAAEDMINKHVVKMILESAQILSTAHREYGNERDHFYKRTHVNHPSCVWVRQSTKHYDWVYKHMIALGKEYTKRYGKKHLTITKMEEVLRYPPANMPNSGFTPPPQCMPDEYKRDCAVAGYKAYYKFKRETIGEK
jgi:hypothetical protein